MKRKSFFLLTAFSIMFATSACMAETLIVTNTSDSTGTGDCAAAVPSGGCSLRQAINTANLSPALTTITFNITTPPMGGKYVIVPTINAAANAVFPVITSPVIIDGESQSGWSANNLVIELRNSSNLPGAALRFGTNGNTVKGILVNSFASGTAFNTTAANNQVIANEYTKSNTLTGAAIDIRGDNNLIKDNYIHDFTPNVASRGILLVNASKNTVKNNKIVNMLGNNASTDGIRLATASRENLIEGNYLENVSDFGIDISFVTDPTDPINNPRPNIIKNNTVVSTGGAIGNAAGIITFNANYNQYIGNTVTDQGSGIEVHGSASNNLIEDNVINGTQATPNSEGILVINTSNNNLFKGNVVINRDSGVGVKSDSHNNQFIDNYIGVDKNGNAGGNTSYGFIIGPDLCKTICFTAIGPTGNLISQNKIAYNGTGILMGSGGYNVNNDGVEQATDALNNPILSNSIYGNKNLGIDLSNAHTVPVPDPDAPIFDIVATLPDGVTANDNKDPDVGANNLQNYPDLIYAKTMQGNLRVQGILHTEKDGKPYLLQFFLNDSPDQSGYGQGKLLLGEMKVVANNGGNANFEFTKDGNFAGWVTVTATELGENDKPLNTSEFSNAVEVK